VLENENMERRRLKEPTRAAVVLTSLMKENVKDAEEG